MKYCWTKSLWRWNSCLSRLSAAMLSFTAKISLISCLIGLSVSADDTLTTQTTSDSGTLNFKLFFAKRHPHTHVLQIEVKPDWSEPMYHICKVIWVSYVAAQVQGTSGMYLAFCSLWQRDDFSLTALLQLCTIFDVGCSLADVALWSNTCWLYVWLFSPVSVCGLFLHCTVLEA